MKFNWGTGIFLFYTLFALSLFYQVYKSTQYDNSLVVENYYEKDLAYQSHYEKAQNSLELKEKLQIVHLEESNSIRFTFPEGMGKIEGSIHFYRPNNKAKDFQLPIRTDKLLSMEIPVQELNSGRWKVAVDWTANNKAYFDEKIFMLQPNS